MGGQKFSASENRNKEPLAVNKTVLICYLNLYKNVILFHDINVLEKIYPFITVKIFFGLQPKKSVGVFFQTPMAVCKST